MTIDQFKNEVENLFKIKLSNDILAKFILYKQFLQKQNKKFNLSNLVDDQIIYQKYFFYGLIPYCKINLMDTKSILDLGSGSGNPGIILKLIYPHLHLTIVEANKKKVNFMQQLVKKLTLKNVVIINKRIELIRPKKNFCFDLCTARAVAKLEILLELITPYCKINGLIVIPKSLNYQKEIKNLTRALNILHTKLLKIDKFIYKQDVFNTLQIKKIGSTPLIFPRKFQDIKKGFYYAYKQK